MEFLSQLLDNGLRIVAEQNPRANSMAIGFFVDTGARDESDQLAGVSHFLEHMTFKGTAKRSAEEINRELDAIGSQSNAYTSEEQTVYYMAFVPDYQDRAVELLADMMRPALRDDDFEVEKQVILEEISKYDDEPPYGAHEKGMAAFFGSHPLGHSVLGTTSSVGALTADQMRAYFCNRYAPENMTLVATGNLDFDRLVKLADLLCGGWAPVQAQRVCAEPQCQQETVWICREMAMKEYLVQISAGPVARDPMRFAHRMLTHVLGDDTNSRLYWEFVDKGLAEYASMASYEYQDAGITMTFMDCEPDDLFANLARLQDLQRQLVRHGITAEELELAKAKICSQVVRRAEKPVNRLFSVGTNWLQRQQYFTVREAVENYRNVTREDVMQSLERFPLDHCTTVFAGPTEPSAGESAKVVR